MVNAHIGWWGERVLFVQPLERHAILGRLVIDSSLYFLADLQAGGEREVQGGAHNRMGRVLGELQRHRIVKKHSRR